MKQFSLSTHTFDIINFPASQDLDIDKGGALFNGSSFPQSISSGENVKPGEKGIEGQKTDLQWQVYSSIDWVNLASRRADCIICLCQGSAETQLI